MFVLSYVSVVIMMVSLHYNNDNISQVEKAEIGKIFSVVGIGQSVIALVSYPLFGLIYHSTLTYFPTAYLLIVIVLLTFAALTSGYLFVVVVRNGRDKAVV